ncbi:MAG: type II toxin-antitoxin system VapC family toxin [Burkholderiales bacterium]|nr:type II toxin-antitoxin system VapC family toxin [Burkholderiales bacterium]
MSAAQPVLHVAEPAASYHLKPALVVDCSVLAGVLFQEPWNDQAQAHIANRTLFAPRLLAYEICNVALKKARKGASLAATEGLIQWQDMDIDLGDVDPTQTFALAQRYQLTVYDAAYLWLAAELKCPLATFDETLAQAARAHLAGLG